MKIAAVVVICGMILNVLGAFIIARSFVVKRSRDVFRELRSLGGWDFLITRGARDLLLSWLVQSVEARSGAFILGFGFLLQAIAQFLPQSPISYGGAIAIIFTGVCAAVGFFFILQAFFVRHAAHRAKGFYNELESEAESREWKEKIPLRRAELEKIINSPRSWLCSKETAPIDTTFTSNK